MRCLRIKRKFRSCLEGTKRIFCCGFKGLCAQKASWPAIGILLKLTGVDCESSDLTETVEKHMSVIDKNIKNTVLNNCFVGVNIIYLLFNKL